jgi:hypothetical protein
MIPLSRLDELNDDATFPHVLKLYWTRQNETFPGFPRSARKIAHRN